MTNKSILFSMVFFLMIDLGCSSKTTPSSSDSPNETSANLTFVADHTSADLFETIPEEYIEAAKTNFKIMYGHTSHGSQIISGMDWLRDALGTPYDYSYTYSQYNCVPESFMCDKTPSGDDLGSSWEPPTRSALDTGFPERNVVMWSWCGQVSGANETYIETYLGLMDGLISDYSTIPFIYMTGHLDGSGEDGNLRTRNNQIRQHVEETGGILFDFADIESYDPDGTFYPDETDACSWCSDWCSAHPEDCQNLPSCAHSHGFNCVRKAKAFWWLMARMAGWDGQPE